MIKSLLNLIKEAFETQCDYAIREVKYNNVSILENRINNTFKKLNKLSEVTWCEISQDYLKLKIKELYLKYELEEKQQEEKEKERAIREQIKQEEKERLKVEKARQQIEETEQIKKQYQEDLKKLYRKMQQAAGTQIDEYKHQIKDLQEKLSKAQTNEDKAISDFTRLKSGYIYVISNIGSLGQDIYRICMTKSSKPDVYVRTMNPSTPFPFDVHFKIFSEDASETIEYLHQQFNDKRVNIVNEKREFFKVRLDEIEQAVKKIYRKPGGLTIEKSEKVPQALEYRRTQATERRSDYHTTLTDSYVEEDGEIA